jgi:hypothetical protein
MTYLGKVSTSLTLFIANNLSVYTKPYKFWKVFTPLMANDLSAYINVTVAGVRCHQRISNPMVADRKRF